MAEVARGRDANQEGEGVDKDLVEAQRWFLLAAKSSSGLAHKYLTHHVDAVTAIVSRDQVEVARKRVVWWRPLRAK